MYRKKFGMEIDEKRERRRRQRQKCLNCVKSVTAFLFSHIGLAAMVVSYSIMGGFLFKALEAPYEMQIKLEIKEWKSQRIEEIWQYAIDLKVNNVNKENFTDNIRKIFSDFQQEVTTNVKDNGWDGNDDTEESSLQWSFAGALLYAVTVITTIGYGHIAPKTSWGRLVTIVYALVGIPLTFLYLSNIGNFLADCFRLFYKRICCDLCCCQKCERNKERERKRLKRKREQAAQRNSVLRPAVVDTTYFVDDEDDLNPECRSLTEVVDDAEEKSIGRDDEDTNTDHEMPQNCEDIEQAAGGTSDEECKSKNGCKTTPANKTDVNKHNRNRPTNSQDGSQPSSAQESSRPSSPLDISPRPKGRLESPRTTSPIGRPTSLLTNPNVPSSADRETAILDSDEDIKETAILDSDFESDTDIRETDILDDVIDDDSPSGPRTPNSDTILSNLDGLADCRETAIIDDDDTYSDDEVFLPAEATISPMSASVQKGVSGERKSRDKASTEKHKDFHDKSTKRKTIRHKDREKEREKDRSRSKSRKEKDRSKSREKGKGSDKDKKLHKDSKGKDSGKSSDEKEKPSKDKDKKDKEKKDKEKDKKDKKDSDKEKKEKDKRDSDKEKKDKEKKDSDKEKKDKDKKDAAERDKKDKEKKDTEKDKKAMDKKLDRRGRSSDKDKTENKDKEKLHVDKGTDRSTSREKSDDKSKDSSSEQDRAKDVPKSPKEKDTLKVESAAKENPALARERSKTPKKDQASNEKSSNKDENKKSILKDRSPSSEDKKHKDVHNDRSPSRRKEFVESDKPHGGLSRQRSAKRSGKRDHNFGKSLRRRDGGSKKWRLTSTRRNPSSESSEETRRLTDADRHDSAESFVTAKSESFADDLLEEPGGPTSDTDRTEEGSVVKFQPESIAINVGTESSYDIELLDYPDGAPLGFAEDPFDYEEEEDEGKVTVPISICLIIIAGYIFAGSVLFTLWEDWDYLTGSYFCFITLSTIGFGDIVPGTDMKEWSSHKKLVLCALWLAFGLSLLAMCFNLMQEEVKEKCKWVGRKLGLLRDEDEG